MTVYSEKEDITRDVEASLGDDPLKGQILPLNEGSTHRGIKSRHAQMLAIGSLFPYTNQM
jgi:amino acid permease